MRMQKISIDGLIALYAKERLPSESTLNQLGVVVRSLRLRFPSVETVCDVTRDMLFAWRDWLLNERGVSRTTWNNYLTHFKLILNFGVQIGRLVADELPTRGVKLLPEYQRRKKTVDDLSLRKVVAYLESTEVEKPLRPGWFWVILVRVMFFTGMRRRQVVSLVWRDINFHEGTILLRAESSKTRREWFIPIPPQVRSELLELRVRTEAKVKVIEPDMQVFNVTLFYPRYFGEEMSVGQLSGFYRRVKERTGVEISAHKVRHTFGTKAANAKGSRAADLKVVQGLMGHTSLKTTMEYLHPDREDQERVVAALSL